MPSTRRTPSTRSTLDDFDLIVVLVRNDGGRSTRSSIVRHPDVRRRQRTRHAERRAPRTVVTPTGRRLRVLWLVKGLGPGGAERLLVEHAAAGDRDRVRVRGRLPPRLEAAPRPELERSASARTAWACERSSIPDGSSRLRRLLRRERYDVVHAHSPVPAIVAACSVRTLPRATRPAFVYTEHNRWPSYRVDAHREPPDLRAQRRRLSRCPTTCATRSILASATRVEVLVHGIDVDAVRAQLVDATRPGASSASHPASPSP